jgi:putative transposase
MAGFAFRKNTTFEWNGNTFRVREITPDDQVLLEQAGVGTLSLVAIKALLTEYAEGRARPEQPTAGRLPVPTRPLDALDPRIREEANRRLCYLRAVCGDGEPVFSAAYMAPRIAAAACELNDSAPPSVSTIHRWLRRYQGAGGDASGLIPRTDRRGSKQPRQADRLLELLGEAVEEAYKASPRATTRAIYSRLTTKVDAANRQLLRGDPLTLPSLRTTYRLMQRADVYDIVALRDGKQAADRRLRLVKGGVRTTRVLERVEIDHTPLDLFLIDERTWLPIGRPTLTLAIDHYSRMPYGYYLSFGDPSAAAVVGALRHGILPKTFCVQALPELPIEGDWPVFGLLESLVVDNGLEFHGVDLDGIAQDLGFRVVYCPKKTPRFKGVIERYFRTFNHFFAHELPGTSMARLHERGDYDPAKHAVLTFAEFKQIFEKWLIDVYAATVHRGIGTTPRERWREGQAAHAPVLPNLGKLKARIGRSVERSLRRPGIELNGIRYSGDALAPILRRYGEGIAVRVVYDPEDLGEVLVWGPDDPDPVEVRALDYEFAKGLTERQNSLIRETVRAAGERAEDAAAVQRAREGIAMQIQALMTSRKLRTRRRSAAIRGLSSSKPEGAPPPVPATAAPKVPVGKASDGTEELPPIFPSFQIKRRREG